MSFLGTARQQLPCMVGGGAMQLFYYNFPKPDALLVPQGGRNVCVSSVQQNRKTKHGGLCRFPQESIFCSDVARFQKKKKKLISRVTIQKSNFFKTIPAWVIWIFCFLADIFFWPPLKTLRLCKCPQLSTSSSTPGRGLGHTLLSAPCLLMLICSRSLAGP